MTFRKIAAVVAAAAVAIHPSFLLGKQHCWWESLLVAVVAVAVAEVDVVDDDSDKAVAVVGVVAD
jgi:hypothetical protein